MGATQRLPRVLGKRLAKDMMLTGRALSAEEAVAHGLVTRLVGAEALEANTGVISNFTREHACRAILIARIDEPGAERVGDEDRTLAAAVAGRRRSRRARRR